MSDPNSTDLNPLDYHDLWTMLQESYHNLQPKRKTVPQFKDAIRLIIRERYKNNPRW